MVFDFNCICKMDTPRLFGINGIGKTSRKRRTNLNRRPSNESESPQDYSDSMSLPSTPADLVSDALIERNAIGHVETELKSSDENGLLGDNTEMKHRVMNDKARADSDWNGNENKVKRLKLKVGGVTHTLHTRSSSDGSSVDGTSAATTHSDAIYPSHKLSQQVSLGYVGEKDGLRGLPWKDFSRTGFSFGKVTSRVDAAEDPARQSPKHGQKGEPRCASAPRHIGGRGRVGTCVRSLCHKIKSTNKKYLVDEVFDDEDDDEIRYLQKLKSSKTASYRYVRYEDETTGKKLQKISLVMNRSSYKSRSVRASDDPEYMDEEDSVSDQEIEPKNEKRRRESNHVLVLPKSGSQITTRQRATRTGRNSPGVPPALPRKQKEQLSEVEQQLKRAEAAQRRRMQNEKAALESQAEAIRKILCQDSSRKKREDKIKRQQEALAQERTVNAAIIASNVVRWVIGPSGTVVTFSEEFGLPHIFETGPCSYPPPREKCVGPSCTKVYKYRDSKSNLPLCSLHCYKAIHEKTQHLTAC